MRKIRYLMLSLSLFVIGSQSFSQENERKEKKLFLYREISEEIQNKKEHIQK